MTTDNIGSAALKAFAARRIRLEDEKDALAEDISAVNAEAKSAGYSPRVFNAAVKRARMSPEKRAEAEQFEMEFALYCDAIIGTEE